jgi:methanogenic corrinoid protein MtbC1
VAEAPALGAGPAAVGIAAVERETGIAKETLRMWERRYGFPAPERDAGGERLYPAEQVRRLALIKRLLDLGHRPGRIVAADAATLAGLIEVPEHTLAPARPAHPPELLACLDLLRQHDVEGLRALLAQGLARRGLAEGVVHLLAPLIRAVGDAWMRGELQVFEEHVFSEAVLAVLRQAIQALPAPRTERRPRVLLTTLPGETHSLGLLMAEALLTLEGCACLSLGVQTPPSQLPAAAAAHRADVVALSFSSYLPLRQVQEGLAALRELLPAGVALWAGGSNRALRHAGLPGGIETLPRLEDVALQVAQWRSRNAAANLK